MTGKMLLAMALVTGMAAEGAEDLRPCAMRTLPLGKPPEAESVEFIVARFQEEGLEISENIPYYLQAMSSLTYEKVTEARRDRVESADVAAAAFDEAYRERHRLPTYSTVHSALKDLIDEGTVESDDAEYRLGDPMLPRYVRQSSAKIFLAEEGANGN